MTKQTESNVASIDSIPEQNRTADVRELHMEIMNTTTREVWIAQSISTRAEYDALELEPPFTKVGIGRGAMDEAYFRAPPGPDGAGPLETREFGRILFSLNARAGDFSFPAGPGGPIQAIIEKHHTVTFYGGRTVHILVHPDGSRYVQATETTGDGGDFQLPEGWKITSITLRRAWKIDVPYPATIFIMPDRRIFHGPLAKVP